MKLSEYFIQGRGVQAALAKSTEIPAPMLSQWASGARPIPIEHCAAIEAATGRQVMRWDLMPDGWHRIWPELIGSDGAPATPETSPQGA